MLAPGGDIETCFGAMNLRRIIPTDMTASAMAHLSILALVILFSEVHPFGAVTAEPIAVDIVTPQEVKQEVKPELKPSNPEPLLFPAPDLPMLTQKAPEPPPAAPPKAAARPQQAAALPAFGP